MIKKILNSKFKKDLAFSYFTQATNIGVVFIQLFLINRYFGVDIYGLLAIIMLTAGISTSLLTSKNSEAVTRFFTRELVNNDLKSAKFILFIGFVIDLIMGLIFILLIYLLSDFIAKTFMKDVNYSFEVFLYSFVVFFKFLRETFVGYFQARELFFQMNTIIVFESFVKAISLIGIIFIMHKHNLSDIIYVFILASGLAFLYSFFIFINYYKSQFYKIALDFNKKLLKEYWSFNLKTFLSSTLKIGHDQVDVLILSYFTSSYVIGIYSIFKKILNVFFIIISQVAVVRFTKIIKFYESKKFSEMLKDIKSKTLFIFYAIIPLFIISLGLLKFIFVSMNIPFKTIYYTIYSILFIRVIVAALMWWWRPFIITHNVTAPIYMNTLNLIDTILFPIILFNIFTSVNPLLLISISNVLVVIPIEIIAFYYFYKYIYRRVVDV
jgi:O-antigen/teichoic acid export membrane protein